MTYQITLVLAPVTEPVTLADMKAHLRVDTSTDDSLISFLITGARTWLERATGRALITQTWRLTMDHWPAGNEISIPRAPLISVTHIKVYEDDTTAQTLDTNDYLVDANADTPRIVFKSVARLAPGLPASGIEIEFVAGYGDTDVDVPEPLAQAVKLLTSHWYEHRELMDKDGLPLVPRGIEAVAALYRRIHL